MFFLGAMLGVLVTIVGLMVFASLAGTSSRRTYQARQTISEIERRAIYDMLATEYAVRQPGSKIVDGTVTEIVRQP